MIQVDSLLLRNARAAVHNTLFSGGLVVAYTAPMPADGAAITTQVALGAWVLPNPAGTVDAGEFVLTPNVEDMADADGVPAWARIFNSAGAWLKDLDAGALGSNAAVILTPAQVYAGGTLRLVRLRLIEPV